MYGAIMGDIVGSTFETQNNRTPYFELFRNDARFTDDTVCTIAIADILTTTNWDDIDNIDIDEISNKLRLNCCVYLNRGFGSLFSQWITNGINKPYNSYGNGCLMRISPVAQYCIKMNYDKQKALKIAKILTQITHNHEQSYLAVSIYIEILYELLSNKNKNLNDKKDIINNILNMYQYEKPLKIINYRVNLGFDLTAKTSLLVALSSILNTESYDDVFYQVVSIGGDSDTYAAIAGAIAESIYGIDEENKNNVKKYFKEFDLDLLKTIDKIY